MDKRMAVPWMQGAISGLVGYFVVALFVAMFDLVTGRGLFHTPGLFGATLFYGLTDPAQYQAAPGPVFAFNGLHLIVFLAIGVVASWLAEFAERGPHFWYIGTVFFMLVIGHLLGIALLAAYPVLSAVPAWLLVAAGAGGFLAMALYLIVVHPELLHGSAAWNEERLQ